MTNADFVRVRRYSKSSCNSAILPQALQSNQLFLIYIRRRQLTNALEFLQERGYSGDLAIFMLANLQNLEVGA
jgi:hypothetical protein